MYRIQGRVYAAQINTIDYLIWLISFSLPGENNNIVKIISQHHKMRKLKSSDGNSI